MSNKLVQGEVDPDHLALLVRLTNIHGELVLKALHDHFVKGKSKSQACAEYNMKLPLLSRKVADLNKVHAMVTQLEPGQIDPIHLAGLFELAKIDDEALQGALFAHLVVGNGLDDICQQFGVPLDLLMQSVERLKRTHYSVSGIAGFYRTRDLGLGS